jgi:hypothetical protein
MNQASVELMALRNEVDALKAEVERMRMQLVACDVGSLANTEKSAKESRINKDNPFWSVALASVYAAVDREMELRTALRAMRKAAEEWVRRGTVDAVAHKILDGRGPTK